MHTHNYYHAFVVADKQSAGLLVNEAPPDYKEFYPKDVITSAHYVSGGATLTTPAAAQSVSEL